MDKTIKLYGSSGCPTCMGAKKYLEQREVPFEYIDVRKDPDGMKVLDDLGITVIPVITCDNWVIPGFSPSGIDRMLKEVYSNGNA